VSARHLRDMDQTVNH